MRKFLLLSALSLIAVTCFCQKSGRSKPAASACDLDEALKQNLVAVTITGTGGHQGPSLKITCKNLRGKFLRLRIPQGQFMEPGDSSFQTLVVAEAQTLALSAKTPAETVLKTFCAQAGDRSPTSGSVFTMGALAPEQLRKLLTFISDKGKLDAPEAQSAVWCVANGSPLSGIGDPEMTRFTAELLGKKVPEYNIKRRAVKVIPGERTRLGKALTVEGNYRYVLEKDEKLVMNLLDAERKFLKQISKEETMKAGEHRSSFHLEVWNLRPGKYVVRVQTKEGRVIKDIEVEF